MLANPRAEACRRCVSHLEEAADEVRSRHVLSVLPMIRRRGSRHMNNLASAASIAPDPTHPKPLLGRVAVVTGGSRGIGACIARELAAAGAHVVVNYLQGAEAAAGVV